MRLPEFDLERFFARWEPSVPALLCASDAESWTMSELLAMADHGSLALWDELSLGYTETRGHPELREEIARLYTSVDSDDVLVFSGAQEAIFALLNVLLDPDDHAVVVWPAYQSLYEVALAAGAGVSLVRLSYEREWTLDLQAIADAVTPATKVVIVNYPHSPTGSHITQGELDDLIGICAKSGAYLLCDEVYRFMELDEASLVQAGADCYERGISLGVMSKSFGMAGLRIGWLAMMDDELLQRVGAFKDYTTICNSAPSEVLAIAALRAREPLLQRNRAIVAENLALLDAFFERNAERVEWIRPASGMVGFPRLRSSGPIDVLAEELAREAGVLILPGSLFDYPGDHFRIGFGRRNLPEVLEAFESFLLAKAP